MEDLSRWWSSKIRESDARANASLDPQMSIRPTAQIAALMSVAALGMMTSAPQYVPQEQGGYGGAPYAGKMKGRRGTWQPKHPRNQKPRRR